MKLLLLPIFWFSREDIGQLCSSSLDLNNNKHFSSKQLRAFTLKHIIKQAFTLA